ncbi:uncharacterized protein LOC135480823 [Liolophura sinensis]|uniref:uncharacterized protein LOC135480823 n=1 Tax=Liolophura sinensis TaxID=3198878 RepID=UPI0031580247
MLTLKCPVHSHAAKKIINAASKLLVKERIHHHRNTKARTLTTITQLQEKLRSTLSDQHYKSLRQAQTNSNQRLDEKIEGSQKRKFELLSKHTNRESTQRPTSHTSKTVINLSSRTLTPNEATLLAKGLNYIPTQDKIPRGDFVSAIEKGLQQLAPGGNVDYMRHQISDILIKATKQKPNINREERTAIKNLRTDNTITIVPADKGRATVILDKNKFNQLVNDMLSDTTTYRQITKDPTPKLEREFRAKLKALQNSNEIDIQLYRKLNTRHPRAPYARASIKVHKNPIKARLLICSRGTVHYNAAQYLTKLPTPLGKTSKSYIRLSRIL